MLLRLLRFIEPVTEAAPAVKIAGVTAGTLFLASAGWAHQLLSQVDAPGTGTGEYAAAGALTITAGALVWVVRQIVGGNLVHRDVTDLAKIAEAHAKALELVAQLVREGHDREKVFYAAMSGNREA